MSQIVKGNLPITIWKKEQENAIDYRVYGTANGSGVETENLLNFSELMDAPSGVFPDETATCDHMLRLTVEPNTKYTLASDGTGDTSGAADTNRSVYFNSGNSVNAVYTGHPITVTSTALGYIYIGFLSSRANAQQYINGTAHLWLVQGSTAPASYIPPGYKIPLSLESGANLWDKSQRDFSTDTILDDGGAITSVGGFGYDRNYTPCEPETDYVISGTIVTSSTSMRLYFFDKDKVFISRSDGYGQQTIPKKFTTPANCYYVTFQAYLSTYDPDTIMITKGSTVPVSYIPHRYTVDYNLYIGDSKLGKEEYVDYGEQKIYKKNPNYLWWASAFVKYDEEGRINIIIECDTADMAALANNCGVLSIKGIYENLTHETEGVAVTTFQGSDAWLSIRARDSGQGVTFRTFININGSYIYGENFGLTAAQVDASTDIYEGIPAAFLEGKKCIYENRPPIVLPVDPPASFPAIQAYQGENTLSSTETVGNVSLEFNEATFYAGNSITQVYTNNQLYDLIDSNFYSLIANSYDSTQTYETDSYCIYNYCLYKCITAITVPEAFNPAKWQQLNLSTCVRGDN